MARFTHRLALLEAALTPTWGQGKGLAALLAEAGLHPPAPWDLPSLDALAEAGALTGMQRLLREALQQQAARSPSS
jgi:hypothetical protein